MRKAVLFFISLLLVLSLSGLQGQETFVDARTIDTAKKVLLEKHGDSQRFRIEKGVDQVASLWRETDGTKKEFEDLNSTR